MWIEPPISNALILEYAAFGSLAEQENLAREDVANVMCQILDAVVYMRSKNFTHRDIKPANILVTAKNPLQVKLGDFGFAAEKKGMMTFLGTFPFIAPEIWNRTPYTSTVDIWAIGVMILGFSSVDGLPNFPAVTREMDYQAWERWSRELPTKPRITRPGWEPLAHEARRLLLERPSPATALQEMLPLRSPSTMSIHHNWTVVRSLPNMPPWLDLVRTDLPEAASPLIDALAFFQSHHCTDVTLSLRGKEPGQSKDSEKDYRSLMDVAGFMRSTGRNDVANQLETVHGLTFDIHLSKWPEEKYEDDKDGNVVSSLEPRA